MAQNAKAVGAQAVKGDLRKNGLGLQTQDDASSANEHRMNAAPTSPPRPDEVAQKGPKIATMKKKFDFKLRKGAQVHSQYVINDVESEGAEAENEDLEEEESDAEGDEDVESEQEGLEDEEEDEFDSHDLDDDADDGPDYEDSEMVRDQQADGASCELNDAGDEDDDGLGEDRDEAEGDAKLQGGPVRDRADSKEMGGFGQSQDGGAESGSQLSKDSFVQFMNNSRSSLVDGYVTPRHEQKMNGFQARTEEGRGDQGSARQNLHCLEAINQNKKQHLNTSGGLNEGHVSEYNHGSLQLSAGLNHLNKNPFFQ